MNKNLRIFLWNDDQTELGRWLTTLATEGFANVIASSELDLQTVVENIRQSEPDVVILDIVLQQTTRTLGVEIAARIRTDDGLVPIIAVSSQPAEVFSSQRDIIEYGFVSVYHDKVMTPGVFGRACLEQSLLRWHDVAPDYALVLKTVRAVRGHFGPKLGFANALIAAIHTLPYLGGSERWYTALTTKLVRLFREMKMDGFASKFEEIAGAFTAGDRYYMAGSNARHHLSHNVQVFLLGVLALLQIKRLRTIAIDSIRRQFQDLSDEECLCRALCVWAGIGCTHDAAYLGEYLSTVVKGAMKAADFFRDFGPGKRTLKVTGKWEAIHHGELGASAWRTCLGSALEQHMANLVARGVERHDSSTELAKSTGPVGANDWPAFLAVLCDELQDWGRSRREVMPGNIHYKGTMWHKFVLQRIEMAQDKERDDLHRIDLDFLAADFPYWIKDEVGMGSLNDVGERLDHTLDVLEQNLLPDGEWIVTLWVHFVSRGTNTQGLFVSRVRTLSNRLRC